MGTDRRSINNTHIKDLGMTVSSDLMCNVLIQSYTIETRMFDFLKQNHREFKDPICLKTLYCLLIRSLL